MMREWVRMVIGGLLGRPFIPQSRRAGAGGVSALWSRWALGVGVAAVALMAALSAFYFHNDMRTAPSSGVVNGTTSQGKTALPYGPLVSRGKTVRCSSDVYTAGESNAITSGKYGDWSFWQADVNKLPSWCAIHIGAGAERLLVVWTSDFIFDYISPYGMTPRDYTLSTSGDSSDGSDGHWQTVVVVKNNETRAREAMIPFTGMSWVKMIVTLAQAQPQQPFIRIDQIDCYDVSAGLSQTVLFEGDSLTVAAYLRLDGTHPTFDELLHQRDPRLFPTMLNEGMGGWNSSGGVKQIQSWLALNPDIHYWLLGWGTNDALQMVAPSTFHDNMQFLIDQIKAAGHAPVLAHIPAMRLAGSRGAQVDAEVRALNAQIDLLTRENHLISGPDLYALTNSHLDTYLSNDGIHPTSAGSVAMNNAWYLAMRDALEASLK